MKNQSSFQTFEAVQKVDFLHSVLLSIDILNLTLLYSAKRGEMSNRAETYAKDRAPYFQAPHHW